MTSSLGVTLWNPGHILIFSHSGFMVLALVLGMALPVGPSLGSRLNYLHYYLMDWCEILCRHSCSPEDESERLGWSSAFYVDTCDSGLNISHLCDVLLWTACSSEDLLHYLRPLAPPWGCHFLNLSKHCMDYHETWFGAFMVPREWILISHLIFPLVIRIRFSLILC